MCTAITYQTAGQYFGRTLDLDVPCPGEVTIMPRQFPLALRRGETLLHHHAMIGMAHVADGFPLYFDAVNEKGLAIAGLNFPGYAHYTCDGSGIASFELIPWLLGQCATVAEARTLLEHTAVTAEPFREDIPPTPLHWLLADRQESLTIEPVQEGLMLYSNRIGVLTNSPPFPAQLLHLADFSRLSPEDPESRLFPELRPHSRGYGALGLPGDLSSPSRFVRAAFTRCCSLSGSSETESVSQFFHILGTVEQVRGCCRPAPGRYELTQYTSCCNTHRGIYYYKTYDSPRITGVDLHREALDGTALIRYSTENCTAIQMQN